MKKLNKLKLVQNAELMDEDQMRMIVGGRYFVCKCVGQELISWQGDYDDLNVKEMLDDIKAKCLNQRATCVPDY